MTQAFDLEELRRHREIIDNATKAYEQLLHDFRLSREEIERMREALKPFADKAALYTHPRYDVLVGVPQKMSFTIGTMRQARAALGQEKS